MKEAAAIGILRLVTAAMCMLILTYNGNIQAEAEIRLHPSRLSSLMEGKTITAIFEDRQGYLWIGTQAGLYHFDGASVNIYSASEKNPYNLPVSDIRGIVDDLEGNLVLATYGGGLSIWEKSTGSFRKVSNDQLLESDYLTGLSRDSDGNFLIHSSFGTLIANSSLDEIYRLSSLVPAISRTKAPPLSIEFSNGSSILAKDQDVFLLNISKKTKKRLNIGSSISPISAMTSKGDRYVFIGTEMGELLYFDTVENSVSDVVFLEKNRKVTVTSIAEYRNMIWIGTDRGLYIADQNLNIIYYFDRVTSQLTNNHITKLYNLRDTLLVGTYSGLDQATPAPFELLNASNSNVYNDVMAIEEDSYGDIWVGTFDGVFKYEQNTRKHRRLVKTEETYLADQRAMSIESIGDEIWIGFWKNGLSIINVKTEKNVTLPFDDLSELSVTKILAQDKKLIWIATYKQGILRVSKNKVTRFSELSNRPVIALTLSPAGKLYAISEKTIFVYEKDLDRFSEHTINYPGEIEEVVLLNLSIDDNERFLLGTKDHGVFELVDVRKNTSSFEAKRFANEPSLSSISVYAILSDTSSNLWLSTDIGIVLLEGSGRLLSIFTEENGLQGNDFSFGAYSASSDGKIYFGGPNGYNRFNPLHIKVQESIPRLTIPSIEIGNSATLRFGEIDKLTELLLTHINYSVTITLGLLDFLDPTRNQYSHILEGFDQSWIDDGTNNKISYTNLAPGEYVFRAKAANSAGIWNEEGVSLKIRVLPPWWLTWWAYCLYVAAALILIWGVMRAYRAHLLKEEALRFAVEMQDSADRAQDDLQDSQEFHNELIRAVHKHNLETLDLIGRCLEPSENGQANPRIRGHLKAMELLEGCYYFQGGMLMANLHAYVDSLTSHLLQSTRVDPVTITTINLITSDLLPARIASPAAVILYELLENALLHAFSRDSAANFIEFRADIHHLSQSNNSLILSVADDGRGWSADSLPPSSQSMGLKIVDALAQSLGGTINVTHDNGSQISLELPLTN